MGATRRKWKNRRGETLIETLVSLLVSTLALSMLAGMMFKSVSLSNKSIDDMKEYTERMNLLNNPSQTESMTEEELNALRNDWNLEPGDATVTVSIVSGDAIISNEPVRYVLDNTDDTISYVKSEG